MELEAPISCPFEISILPIAVSLMEPPPSRFERVGYPYDKGACKKGEKEPEKTERRICRTPNFLPCIMISYTREFRGKWPLLSLAGK